jgi:hypothetical protein
VTLLWVLVVKEEEDWHSGQSFSLSPFSSLFYLSLRNPGELSGPDSGTGMDFSSIIAVTSSIGFGSGGTKSLTSPDQQEPLFLLNPSETK